MAPSASVNVPPAEIVFAQRLASNEPKIRRLALKKLKKYIASRCNRGGFSQEDLLKLWKGLHYCMWMQDKPLLQEEFADCMCTLTHAFGNNEAAVMYLTAYLDTQCREWMTIDKWRVDKFMMLFRRMLRQGLELLKSNSWDSSLTGVVLGVLSDKVICDSSTPAPEGIRYHLADIYLDELSRVGGLELSADQTLAFLEPWISASSRTRNKAYLNHVVKSIFGQLILASSVGLEDSTADEASDEEAAAAGSGGKTPQISQLQVDYGELSRRLFLEASGVHCLVRNRTPLYDLVKKFKVLSEGTFPCEEEVTSGSDQELTEADFNAAIRRLGKLENAVSQSYGKALKARELSKKKNRKRPLPEAGGDSSTDEQAAGDGGRQEAEQSAGSTRKEAAKKKKNAKRRRPETADSAKKPAGDGGRPAKEGQGSVSNGALGGHAGDECLPSPAGSDMQPIDSASEQGCGGCTAADPVVAAAAASGSSAAEQHSSSEGAATAEAAGDTPSAEASNSMPTVGTVVGRRKKGSKVGKGKSSGSALGENGSDLEDGGDVEIWIPNKRYKGPLKEAFAEAQKKAATPKNGTSDLELSHKKKFAAFVDSTEAAATAAASSTFFRRAASKVQSKENTKKNGKKSVGESALTGKASGSKNSKAGKRVSFGSSSAIGDTGLKFSTEEVFKPHISPCQGVIKTRSVTAKDKTRVAAASAVPVRRRT